MSDTTPPQPSKGQQILACIAELEVRLQIAAGGQDPKVQAVLAKMKAILAPVQS